METHATFTVDLNPAEALLPETGRFEFSKSWFGGASGTSRGVMLSAGDPGTGNAGYVALEVFEGSIGEKSGTLVFQQSGTMTQGEDRLSYEVVPGSGTGDFAGTTGVLHLTIDENGQHRVRFALS